MQKLWPGRRGLRRLSPGGGCCCAIAPTDNSMAATPSAVLRHMVMILSLPGEVSDVGQTYQITAAVRRSPVFP